MKKYKLTVNFSDGSFEEVDELFDSKEEALEEYDSWVENYSAGGMYLKEAGEDYDDADVEDYDIEEVDED